MLARYIQVPSGTSLKEVMAGFEDLGFPHCAGAVDGTHIPVVLPREFQQTTIIGRGGTPSSCKCGITLFD